MFKKNALIAGLLTALVIVLIGCVDALPPPEGEVVEVTRLSELIKDAPDGVLDDDGWKAIFADTPFMKCGPSRFSIITDGGVKKLKIDKMINNWGEGLDVRHAPTADGNSGAGYKVGDEITIKGTADPEGIIFNAKGGSYAKVDNWRSGPTFDKTVTLTSGDLANIQSGSPQTIRLVYDDGAGDSRRGVIIFEEIVVKGMRSAGDKIEIPDYSVANADAYNVNALKPATGEVYIDLGKAVKFNLTAEPAKFPVYVVKGENADDPGALFANFWTKTDAVFIPFTDDVRKQLQDAVKAQYTFVVDIVGSTNADPAATNANVRWCFGQDTGSSWNISNMIAENNFAKALKGKVLNEFSVVDNMKGIVIQAGGGNVADISPYTGRINSIKVTLKPPTKVVSGNINFGLKAPAGGATAPTSVTGTGWTGAITWTPPLPSNGKWALSTVYFATITITPATDYVISSSATFGVSGITGVQYNSFTKQVMTPPYTSTAATPVPLPAFELSKDAGFNTFLTAGNDSGSPFDNLTSNGALVNAGSPTFTIKTFDGKKYIEVKSNATWGDGVDLSDDFYGFEPGDVIKVVVQLTNIVVNPTASNFQLLLNIGGWSPVGATYDITDYSDANLTAEKAKDITFERTLTAANISSIAAASPKAIRLRFNNHLAGSSYIIKEISVTGNGRK